MTTLTADSVRDELVRRLHGLASGNVRVVGVEVTDEWWPDEEDTLRLVLHLSDPLNGTWNVTDVGQLRRRAHDAARAAGVEALRVFVSGGQPIDDGPIPDEESP